MTDLTRYAQEETLLSLQLRVARKADELAKTRQVETSLNLHCWLLAEREILGPIEAWRERGMTENNALEAREPDAGSPSSTVRLV